jgi:hypothetical protein
VGVVVWWVGVVVWWCVVWCGVVWCGVVWCGVVLCCVVLWCVRFTTNVCVSPNQMEHKSSDKNKYIRHIIPHPVRVTSQNFR